MMALRGGLCDMIPKDIEEFIQTYIPSVWTLELLLLMRRHPAASWGVEALNRELRSSALVVTGALATLIAAGLVVEDTQGSYVYRPARAELVALLDRLADTYARLPLAVTRAILAAPNDKIRIFADAFRIKKD